MNPQAYQDGDTSGTGAAVTGVSASSVSFTATDASTIIANVAAASLAVSVAGTAAVSVSIGVSLAMNTIDDAAEAYVANASHGVTTTSAGISLTTMENATIQATAVAASLAVGASFGRRRRPQRRGRPGDQQHPWRGQCLRL